MKTRIFKVEVYVICRSRRLCGLKQKLNRGLDNFVTMRKLNPMYLFLSFEILFHYLWLNFISTFCSFFRDGFRNILYKAHLHKRFLVKFDFSRSKPNRARDFTAIWSWFQPDISRGFKRMTKNNTTPMFIRRLHMLCYKTLVYFITFHRRFQQYRTQVALR